MHMSTTVPASTAIKRNRIKNIDTDRLVARQAYLVALFDGPTSDLPDRRVEYIARASELAAIEDHLDHRGVVYTRRTLTPAQRGAPSYVPA